MKPDFDARAWLVWVVAGAVMMILARNPLYAILLLLVVRLVVTTCAKPGLGVGLPLLRLGVIILLFATLFNAISVHVGQTVLFRLPANWPLVGGAVTVEAAVYGAANGVVLLNLLVLFTGFNQIVASSELVRLTPRALRDLGVVVLIAVTYVPETLQQLKRVQEAQAIRGHRLHGWRDWQPVVMPLLISGLERAMGLAESMVARGFGATADTRQPLAVQITLLAGLGLAFAGWVWSFWIAWWGWGLLVAGLLLVLGVFWWSGRQMAHTRYRPRTWTGWDTGLVATAVFPLLLILVPWPFVRTETLTYSPYPALTLPGLDPVLALSMLGFLFPVLVDHLKN